MKKLWNIFSDYCGETILHPQFIINSYLQKARNEALKQITGDLIDIGCGRMSYKSFFLQKATNYTGLDHPLVSKVYNGKTKPDILVDIHKTSIKKDTYDSAVCFEVLEYLTNPQQALLEINRILKPTATFVLTVPFLYPIHDAPHDRYRFTKTALEELLKNAGFKIKRIEMRGSFWQFWFQSLLVYLFKSIMQKPVLVIFLPLIEILVIILNILSVALSQFSKKVNTDYPITTFVIAQKK